MFKFYLFVISVHVRPNPKPCVSVYLLWYILHSTAADSNEEVRAVADGPPAPTLYEILNVHLTQFVDAPALNSQFTLAESFIKGIESLQQTLIF